MRSEKSNKSGAFYMESYLKNIRHEKQPRSKLWKIDVNNLCDTAKFKLIVLHFHQITPGNGFTAVNVLWRRVRVIINSLALARICECCSTYKRHRPADRFFTYNKIINARMTLTSVTWNVDAYRSHRTCQRKNVFCMNRTAYCRFVCDAIN